MPLMYIACVNAFIKRNVESPRGSTSTHTHTHLEVIYIFQISIIDGAYIRQPYSITYANIPCLVLCIYKQKTHFAPFRQFVEIYTFLAWLRLIWPAITIITRIRETPWVRNCQHLIEGNHIRVNFFHRISHSQCIIPRTTFIFIWGVSCEIGQKTT